MQFAIISWPDSLDEYQDGKWYLDTRPNVMLVRERELPSVAQAEGWLADFLLCEGRRGTVHGIYDVVLMCGYCEQYAVDVTTGLCAQCAYDRKRIERKWVRCAAYSKHGYLLMAGQHFPVLEQARTWNADWHDGKWAVELWCPFHGWQAEFEGACSECLAEDRDKPHEFQGISIEVLS